jgi:hypothetical protein
MLAYVTAYRDFERDAAFTAECSALEANAVMIETALLALSEEATELAESASLPGSCQFMTIE